MTSQKGLEEFDDLGRWLGPTFLPQVRSTTTRRIPRPNDEVKAWLRRAPGIEAIEAVIRSEAPFLNSDEIDMCRSAFEAGLRIGTPSLVEGSFGLAINAPGEFHQRNFVGGRKSYAGEALFWIDPDGVIRTGWTRPGSIGPEPSVERMGTALSRTLERSLPVAVAPILEGTLATNAAARRKAIERFCASAGRIGALRFAEALFTVLEARVRTAMDMIAAGRNDVDLGEAIWAAAIAVGYEAPGASSEGARARKITERLSCYVRLVAFVDERMREAALGRAPAVEAAVARRIDFDRAKLAGRASIEAYNWLGGATGAEGEPGRETWPDAAEAPSERASLWRRQAAGSLGHLLPLLVEVDALSARRGRLTKTGLRLRSVVDEGRELIGAIASEFGISPATVRFVRDRVKLGKSNAVLSSERAWLAAHATALEVCPKNWLLGLSPKKMDEAIRVVCGLQVLADAHGYPVRDFILERKGKLTFAALFRGNDMTVIEVLDDSRRYCVETLANISVAAGLHDAGAIEDADVQRVSSIQQRMHHHFANQLSTRAISGANTLAQLLAWSAEVHRVMEAAAGMPSGWGEKTAWPALIGRFGDEAALHAVELTSVAAILAEAEAMKHCVATYVPSVTSGQCVLFRLVDRNAHLGTVEIAIVDGVASVRQAAGFRNGVLPEPTLRFCKRLESATGSVLKSTGRSYLMQLEESTARSREAASIRGRLEAKLKTARLMWPSLAPLIAGPFKNMTWREAGEHLKRLAPEDS